MNNLFFWIILLSLVIPIGTRMYRKSVQRKDHNQSFSGRYPEQFPGGFPGQQSNQPRDGFTQQDYLGGGFRQIGAPSPMPPMNPEDHRPQQDFQPYQDFNPQQKAGEQQQAPAPVVPSAASVPQGFRARKLAELDAKYSNRELSMEEYMVQRAEIMKG